MLQSRPLSSHITSRHGRYFLRRQADTHKDLMYEQCKAMCVSDLNGMSRAMCIPKTEQQRWVEIEPDRSPFELISESSNQPWVRLHWPTNVHWNTLERLQQTTIYRVDSVYTQTLPVHPVEIFNCKQSSSFPLSLTALRWIFKTIRDPQKLSNVNCLHLPTYLLFCYTIFCSSCLLIYLHFPSCSLIH